MENDSNEKLAQGKFQGKVLEKLDNIDNTLLILHKKKVDKIEFAPVKAIAYGLVGIIMIAVVGAIVATVVQAIELII